METPRTKAEAMRYLGAVVVENSQKSRLIGKIIKGILWSGTDDSNLPGSIYLLVENEVSSAGYYKNFSGGFTDVGETHLRLAELDFNNVSKVYFLGCPLRTKFLKEHGNE